MKWKTDSMISKGTKRFILLATFFIACGGQAEVIQIEADELPTESVIPLLDSNMAVKNRSIPFTGRLELGFMTGTVIDEMFFNNTLWGIQLFYYFNEDSAWGLKYADRLKGLSSYSEQFQSTSAQLDFQKAPSPSTVIAASYRWSFLYGKMSLSKETVVPTVFSIEADLGVHKIGTQNLPWTSAGISHKVFVKKHIGVGLSYRLLLYQTLDPVSADVGSAAPTPSESDFDKKIQISQSLDVAVTYLF
ncbi:outer membrane beta-barrel domain-containing protein [Bdellovibrio bacteriovorus]|uniref:outer membrane beta-barrel domain-containing protein n=1 Tax=Bdellovibrio TaxID=958 RepID=UPI0035A97938